MNPERIPPIGMGGELEKNRETLPAIEVNNHVVWTNPEFSEMPFNLKEGEKAKLGIFFTPDSTQEGAKNIEVAEEHHRSGLLGRVIFKDAQGRLYRDVDIKGMGQIDVGHEQKTTETGVQYYDFESKKFIVHAPGTWGNYRGIAGILDLLSAYQDKDMAEILAEQGVSVPRVLALIRLDEVVDETGKRVAVEESKNKQIPNVKPTLEIRAYPGTKMRLEDVEADHLFERKSPKKILFDAAALLTGEKEKQFRYFEDFMDYFMDLAKRIGKNVGLMHKNNWLHGYITEHNITLDGTIVDFDSVKSLRDKTEQERKKLFDQEKEQMKRVVKTFLMHIEGAFQSQRNNLRNLDVFEENYQEKKKRAEEEIFGPIIDELERSYAEVSSR